MPALSITLADLPGLLRETAERLERLDLTKPLKTVRVLLAADTKSNFFGSHEPDGTPWKPLSPNSRRRPRDRRGRQRGGTPKPLLDTSVMMASVTVQGATGNVTELSSASLVWGTNLKGRNGFPYPAVHQFGSRTVPARPFLGWSPGLLARVGQVLSDFAAQSMLPGESQPG